MAWSCSAWPTRDSHIVRRVTPEREPLQARHSTLPMTFLHGLTRIYVTGSGFDGHSTTRLLPFIDTSHHTSWATRSDITR